MVIHVVGNVCLDSSFRLARLPQPGETLNAEAVEEGLGGKGANQAVAAARTGAAVVLWTAVGNDVAGERMRDLLTTELDSLRLSCLDRPSDRSVILVDDKGENLIVTAAACASHFDPVKDDALAATWKSGDVLLMQGNLSVAATDDCLRKAKAGGLFTILNPSPLPEAGLEMRTVSLLVANRPETERLTGERDPQAAALRLRALGVEQAVITLGGEGALLHGNEGSVHVPARKTDVIDTSGAGDCFAGTLAGLLHRGVPLVKAAEAATAAAALAVSRVGTLAAFPTRAELSALMTSLKLDNA
jgi:ribokinase